MNFFLCVILCKENIFIYRVRDFNLDGMVWEILEVFYKNLFKYVRICDNNRGFVF